MPTPSPTLAARRERYFDLSSRIAEIDSGRLATLLGVAPEQGWGATHTIRLGASKVFVKRVPVTVLEFENPFSTANLYGLPTFYNYGVGSAGFGAFREIVANIKATNWTLAGAPVNVPLLYSYRIVPSTRPPQRINEERHGDYIRYWAGDANIDRYIRARASAEYEAILFLEHFPHVLDAWLMRHLDRFAEIVDALRPTLAFLREQGILHFDAHFANIVVDGGGIPYLTDFGLVLDRSFTLTTADKAFFRRHGDYDEAEFMLGIGAYLYPLYRNLAPRVSAALQARYGIAEEMSYWDLVALLVANVEEIRSRRWMRLPDRYVSEVVRYRDVILTMLGFYAALRSNDRKDTPYPERRLKALLQVPSAG